MTTTVTVTDPSTAPASEPFDVTVNPVNDAPATVDETFDVAAGNCEPAIGNTTLQLSNLDTVTAALLASYPQFEHVRGPGLVTAVPTGR